MRHFLEFFVEGPELERKVRLLIQTQHLFQPLHGKALRSRFTARAMKPAGLAVFRITLLPAPDGAVAEAQDLGTFPPFPFARQGVENDFLHLSGWLHDGGRAMRGLLVPHRPRITRLRAGADKPRASSTAQTTC